MKNIIQNIKDFKYKTLTALIFLIINIILSQFVEWAVLWYSGIAIFSYLIFVIYRLIFYGIKNLYVIDKNKTLAIIFSILTSVFTGILIYLLASNLL